MIGPWLYLLLSVLSTTLHDRYTSHQVQNGQRIFNGLDTRQCVVMENLL